MPEFDEIAQLQAELNEFKIASKELETELEAELDEADARQKELLAEIKSLKSQVSDWKDKYASVVKEAEASQTQFQKELANLKDAHQLAHSQLREVEITNDDMERHGRITQSSLEEVNANYLQALEQIALLQAELSLRDDLNTDLQRTRDNLRETEEELGVANMEIMKLRHKLDEAVASTSFSTTTSANTANSTAENTSTGAKLSDADNKTRKMMPPSSHTVRKASTASTSHTVRKASTASTSSIKRITTSRSLRKIHGIIDQVRNIESRVATFKTNNDKDLSKMQIHTPAQTPAKQRHVSSKRMSPLSSSPSTPISPSPASTLTTNYQESPVSGWKSSGSNGSIGRHKPKASVSSHVSSSSFDATAAAKAHKEAASASNKLERIEGSPSEPPRQTKNSLFRSSTDLPKLNAMSQGQKKPGVAFAALTSRSAFGHGRI